jgi:hypothetical protein
LSFKFVGYNPSWILLLFQNFFDTTTVTAATVTTEQQQQQQQLYWTVNTRSLLPLQEVGR